MEQPKKNPKASGFLMQYWKLILGAICLGFYLNSHSTLFLIAGIVLLMLHFSEVRKKNASQQNPENQADQVQTMTDEPDPIPPVDEETWICTSCGATTKGDRCEYCDSPRENSPDEDSPVEG